MNDVIILALSVRDWLLTSSFVDIAKLWLLAIYGYLALTKGKDMFEQKRLTLFWKVHLFPVLPIFLWIDRRFNAIIGTLMFLELPKEHLFTARVKRHARTGKGWRKALGLFWARNLNAPDEDHVSLDR